MEFSSMELEESQSGSELGTEDRCADFEAWQLNTKASTGEVGCDDSDLSGFEILNAAQLVQYMENSVLDIADLLQESCTVTRLLLAHFKWDREALLERFYDRDKHVLFTEANINSLTLRRSAEIVTADQCATSPAEDIATVKSGDASAVQVCSAAVCRICFDEKFETMYGLGCGHRFCKSCWQTYLTHSIMNEGLCQNITCAEYGCQLLVDDAMVLELITDPRVKVKYNQLISNSFVSCHKLLRWCPAPDCGQVVKVESPTTQYVTCGCGEKFCFMCGDIWHNPIPCLWLKKWRLKCSSDSSTSVWIASNTKECPKCHATIEKDGGCNHIVCRSENCMYEFCWVCMGPWLEHGQNAWYTCNRFNDQGSKDARTAMEKSRAGMLRFLHFHSRFSNHQQSLGFENDIYRNMYSKIEEIRKMQGMGWNEVNFLKTAVDALSTCRRTLMNTYVFAYFLQQSNQSLIFEDNQRDLELATEQLSEYLERDIYKKTSQDMKQKIKDKTNYCNRRCRVLISHVREGFETGCWHLMEDA